MTGLLNPKSSEMIRFLFLHDSRCVPRSRDFSTSSGFSLIQISLELGEVLSSQIEEPQKQYGAPSIVSRVSYAYPQE